MQAALLSCGALIRQWSSHVTGARESRLSHPPAIAGNGCAGLKKRACSNGRGEVFNLRAAAP